MQPYLLDVEEGEWVEGHLTGEGKRSYADGTVYSGTFVDGKLEGQAVVAHPDSHRWEEEFRQGKICNGRGAVRHPNGEVQSGEWKNGVFTGS